VPLMRLLLGRIGAATTGSGQRLAWTAQAPPSHPLTSRIVTATASTNRSSCRASTGASQSTGGSPRKIWSSPPACGNRRGSAAHASSPGTHRSRDHRERSAAGLDGTGTAIASAHFANRCRPGFRSWMPCIRARLEPCRRQRTF
jgi:hypothetical protein